MADNVVDPEFLCSLFDKQEGKCFISKLPIQGNFAREDHPYGPIWRPIERTASLDRLDPTKGYTRENVVLTHILINMSKRDLQLDDYIRLCRAVAEASTAA